MLLNCELNRDLKEYRVFENAALIDRIIELAKPLKGARVLHLSMVPTRQWLFGSIDVLVALMRSVGIDAERRLLVSDFGQVGVVRAPNLALGGQFAQWTPEMYEAWVRYPKDVAAIFRGNHDFIVVHDHGINLADVIRESASRDRLSRTKWIWHCHSNLSKVQPDWLDKIVSCASTYDARIVSALDGNPRNRETSASIIPPVIDPMDLSNRHLSENLIDAVVRRHGLETQQPYILVDFRQGQDLAIASRIVDGFRRAKERIDGLQLMLLLGGDGDARQIVDDYEFFALELRGVPDVIIEPLVQGVGNTEVNALQRAAAAVIGECSTENDAIRLLGAMWKGRPVIVSSESASVLHIEDGLNGMIAPSSDEYAEKIVRLLESPEIAAAIGHQARKHMQGRFLITGLLHDYIAKLNELGHSEELSAICHS